MSTFRYARLTPVLLFTVALGTASAQTHVVAPPNKYKPADDVKLGQEAAAQVQKELPLLNDGAVDEYVAGIGQRLVRVIPAEYQHSEFRYTFRVVNQKEINAFALPGGPMFLNRGMIEAARDEGEIAGVMAHELSHVLLRHGTAQATKGEKFQIGAIAGQVLGAIVGGTAGSIIANGSNLGLSTYFMKFSREYESQADILGVQLMARAGYNPQSMANMFKTLAAQGGGGPEFLSDHPNPGNREQRIQQEARVLNATNNPSGNTAEFQRVQGRLKGMSPALTAKQIEQQGPSRGTTGTAGTTGRQVNVDPPSGSLRTYQPSNGLRVSVPANWSQVEGGGSSVTYAPQGAYFQGNNGGGAFTHGVEIGTAQGTGNLQNDTNSLLRSFAQSNPQLQQSGNARNENVGGRNGITVQLANVSEVTGQPEYISLSTTELRNGGLLYVIGVAPRNEAGTYDNAFKKVRQNIQISDR
jgi:Zn-dependent protease with chaperone function